MLNVQDKNTLKDKLLYHKKDILGCKINIFFV